MPGDKSISHRALLVASLAKGESRLRGLLSGADPRSTAEVLRALGVAVPSLPSDGRELRMIGVGVKGLRSPAEVLDCGNSGTTARLLLGVLAGQDVTATLTGDESLRRRPMARVTRPLSRMGAHFDFLETEGALPIQVKGRALGPLTYDLPVASAQVKSALLLAGLTGGVSVQLTEPGHSRDHTERMLTLAGCSVTSRPVAGANEVQLLDPPEALEPLDLAVPGDFSSAAFFLALGILGGGGDVLTLRHVGLNPTRTGLLAVLKRMGADYEIRLSATMRAEPVGDIVVRPSSLVGTDIEATEIPALIDEIPVLAVIASRARGTTRLTGAGELRLKESDRLGVLASNLRGLGVNVEELNDDLVIDGREEPLRGRADAHMDHRIAMAFGVLGALPGCAIDVAGGDSVDVSFPRFWEELGRMSRGERDDPGRRVATPSSRRPGGEPGLGAGRIHSKSDGPIVVIDGPAGSGKSTTAREVARRLGFRHLDSGALYRALTFALLDVDIPPDSWPELTEADLDAYDVDVEPSDAGFRLTLGGRSLGPELRTPEVTGHVSDLAQLPAVRRWLLHRQREAGELGRLVADGRDLGTVVFPRADVKVFLVADLAERARRRIRETDRGDAPGTNAIEEEAARLHGRDEQDSSRLVAPLRRADDAVLIDTTNLSVDQQVEAILALVRRSSAG